MKNLIPVEGRPNLHRDKNSGAIVNTDSSAYQQHLKHIQKIENEQIKIENLENEVKSMKNDIMEIKNLLLNLANKS